VTALILLISVSIIVGIITIYPYPFFGPFEKPPSGIGGNCDLEYRFKADTKIESADEFIQFLKNHQYNGNLSNYKPTILELLPNRTSLNIQTHLNSQINLDLLKGNVIITTSKALFSNEKIFILEIKNQDFNDSYPWSLTIKMSENGYISLQYCAGI
jgi:hypothetical protein